MEAAPAFRRPVKTESPARDGDGNGDGNSPSTKHPLVKMGNSCGKQELETDDKTSTSSNHKDLSCTKLQGGELESARAEMGEVREENERLKISLNKMMKDYEALRTQYLGMVGGEANNKSPEKADDETELISLTLGRFPATEKNKKSEQRNEEGVKECLSLGLSCKFDAKSTAAVKEGGDSPNRSLTNSCDREDQGKEEEAGETSWPPSKSAKTMRSGEDDAVASQNPPKRARVCVRARCETATMNDGCQWRKYGQKISKGNPCPRAYYRCTGSATCPVRKQVQRCADDMSVLVTTYEGNHNHQLPVSATAMASTTSAAASMLLSGSSTSAAAAANLNGHNYYLSSNNPTNSKPNFYLPNNPSNISSTPPTHPTITLDLTSNPSTHFGKFASTTFNNSRYPFTSQLDFGSSRNNVLSWNNGLVSYNNRNNNLSTTTNNIYQNYIQQQRNSNLNNNHHNVAAAAPSLSHQQQQQPLPDTIAAATKAITTDPSFQSALVAALTSIIGTGSRGHDGVIKSSMTTNCEQPLFQLASTMVTNKGNGCGTSVLSNAAVATGTGTANNSTAGTVVFVSESSLPFSKPKSMSVSLEDHIDLTN